MADIFYLSSEADAVAAYGVLGGRGARNITHSGAAGWYAVTITEGMFFQDTGMTTPVASAPVAPGGPPPSGGVSLDGADKVYLYAPAAIADNTFNAGDGTDEYIITQEFATAAAGNPAASVVINDPGSNIFTFKEGIQISSINVTDGTLEIIFGSSEHKALKIENTTALTRFKFGEYSVPKTLDKFKEIVEMRRNTPGDPHMVQAENIPGVSVAFTDTSPTTATLPEDKDGSRGGDEFSRPWRPSNYYTDGEGAGSVPFEIARVTAVATLTADATTALGGVTPPVTYSLGPDTPHEFAIDAKGAIFYRGAPINFEDEEAQKTFTLQVKAQARHEIAFHPITISVTDLPDPTIFTNAYAPTTATVPGNTDGSTEPIVITTVKGHNVYGGTNTYELDEASKAAGFAIDPATGQITYTGTGLDRTEKATHTLTITAMASAGPGRERVGDESATHDLVVTVSGPNNTAPTATPGPQSVNQHELLHFERADFGFTDDTDIGAALASITITSLPDRGRLLFNGDEIEADQVIDADHIGAGTLHIEWYNGEAWEINTDNIVRGVLVYLADDTATEDYKESFTYTVNDGVHDSDEAPMEISVTATDASPFLRVDDYIVFNIFDPLTLTRPMLEASDFEADSETLAYTLVEIDGTSHLDGSKPTLETSDGNADNPTWTDLAIDDTFTQQQVNDGHVRLNAHDEGFFVVSVSDGESRDNAITETIYFESRLIQEIKKTELGGAHVDLSDADPDEKSKPKLIKTGFGESDITPGTGDDVVDPGLGDDDVDLGLGGEDVVIYRFEMRDGNIIAWGGGDTITGFTPGEDRLLLDVIGGDATFLDGLGDGFTATLTTAYDTTPNGEGGGDGGDRTSLASYNVTGIEIHFSEAILLPGGVLGGSILSIAFDTPMAWGDTGIEGEDGYTPGFKTTWLTDEAFSDAEAFNEGALSFNNNAAGRAALMRILGLGAADGGDAPRSVAVGNDGDNVIDLANDVAPEEQTGEWVVFGGGGNDEITLGAGTEEVVYRLGVDEAGAITPADGSDTVGGFTLGTDRITFVDTDGAPAALADLQGGLTLTPNPDGGGNSTGVTLTLGGDTLQITFVTATTSTATGLAHITDLFGADNISVVDTLPPELL